VVGAAGVAGEGKGYFLGRPGPRLIGRELVSPALEAFGAVE